MMNFIYTRCSDVCPLAELKLTKVQEALRAHDWLGTRVVFISVTFDPRHDTPAVLKAYGARFRADPAGWYFPTGSPAAVGQLLAAARIPVRVVAATGVVEHALPRW